MSSRGISPAEQQANNALDIVIAKRLPAILEKLPADVSRSITNTVYDLLGSPVGKVPAEVILKKKYKLLVDGGHIPAFTAEEIVEANKKDIKEEPV